jgi:hypothetical protein
MNAQNTVRALAPDPNGILIKYHFLQPSQSKAIGNALILFADDKVYLLSMSPVH